MNACARLRPDCDFAYFSDNDNVPYGNLSHDKILSLAMGFFGKMARLSPRACVVACNTVTAECIDKLRQQFEFPIIGIQPAVKPAAAFGGRCIVLATPATAASKSLSSLVERYGRGNTEVIACPELASYIEKNIFSPDKRRIFGLLPRVKAQAIVLGCTHYTYIKKTIEEFYNCPTFDGTAGTAAHFDKILGKSDHLTHTYQKISFLSGNIAVNSRIYRFLTENRT